MILLRPASWADCDLLFQWRNDPVTRAASINTNEVNRNGHEAWLSVSLESAKRKILIAEKNGVPIGTVRTDYVTFEHDIGDCGSGWELSWTVSPDHRNRHYGTAMVTQVAAGLLEKTIAVIKPENVASIKIAQSAGFKISGYEGGLLRWERHL